MRNLRSYSWLQLLMFTIVLLPRHAIFGKPQNMKNKSQSDLYKRITFNLNSQSIIDKYNPKKNELLLEDKLDIKRYSPKSILKGADSSSSTRLKLNLKMRLRRGVDSERNDNKNTSLTDWKRWSPCNATQCRLPGLQERRRQCLTFGAPAKNQLICKAALVEFRNCTIPCGENENTDQERPTVESTMLEMLSLLRTSTVKATTVEPVTEEIDSFVTSEMEELTAGSATIGAFETTQPKTEETKSEYFTTKPEVLTVWGNWSDWEPCSVTCGAGVQSRSRECAAEDARSCSGIETQIRRCQEQVSCPFWQEWERWGTCSVSCGEGGTRSRGRLCVTSREATAVLTVESSNEILKQTLSQQPALENQITVVNSSLCPGGSGMSEEVEACVLQVTCQRRWSLWRPWSRCSATCGIGHMTARRECLGGDRDGEECSGNDVKYKRCYSPPCWSSWTRFSECSKSCGGTGGIRTRERDCVGTSNVLEEYKSCIGLRMETEVCNTETCPIWGPWSRFGRCSKSCNSGTKARRRTCLSGRCSGRSREVMRCNYQACPTWSNWSVYSCCSVTCGGNGFKERTRNCRSRGFGLFGTCIGRRRERVRCSMRPCNETVPSVFDSFECGLRTTRRTSSRMEPVLRIFGGQESKEHGWPWQASWQHRACYYCDWIHFCGATLVAPQWVVTASHCTEESAYRVNHNEPGDSWSVVLGMHRLYKDGQRQYIRRVFVHPNYEYVDVTVADIALLKLQRPVRLSTEISPVCLPRISQPTPGERCFITGWGYTASPSNPNAQLSIELLEASVPLMRFSDCQRLGANYKNYLNRRSHMCAGDPISATSDSCIGDSGGPLVCRRRRNKWYFAGVTSFGFSDCGSRGHVGIYAPVNTYERWIRNTIESYSHDSC